MADAAELPADPALTFTSRYPLASTLNGSRSPEGFVAPTIVASAGTAAPVADTEGLAAVTVPATSMGWAEVPRTLVPSVISTGHASAKVFGLP